MHNSETKLQKHLRQQASDNQQQIDCKDAQTITDMFNALLSLDVASAQEIIKKPHAIKGLIDGTHNFRCVFAMHAIVIALISCDCLDILNDMTDAEIATLKECISIAKQFQHQDTALLDSSIAQRRAELNTLAPKQRTESQHMILALTIASKVNNPALWDECIKELNKWSDAIDGFVRQPQQNSAPTQTPEPQYWSIRELAKKLGGINEYHIRNHIRACTSKGETNQVQDWFITQNGRIKFNSEHFTEYQALFQAYKAKSAKKPSEPAKAESVLVKPAKFNNLLDIKAFVAYLKALEQEEERIFQKLKSAREISERIRADIASETNETKLAHLLESATQQNELVIEIKKEYATVVPLHKKAVAFYEEYQDAERKFTDITKAIRNFMATQQKKK